MNIQDLVPHYKKVLTQPILQDITEENPILFFRNFFGRTKSRAMTIIGKNKLQTVNFHNPYDLRGFKHINILDKIVTNFNVFPYVSWVTNRQLFPHFLNEKIEEICITRPKIIIKLSKSDDSYSIDYFYKISEDMENDRQYKILHEENIRITNSDIFVKQSIIMYNKNLIPRSMKPFTFEPNTEYNKVILYRYQKDDIIWMKKIENEDYNIEVENTKINYRGGNIISEMGLGKSIIVLSFIVDEKNQYDKYIKEYSKNCNYFYKNGKYIHQNCTKKIKENELYCNEHKKRNFHDKLKLELNIQLINDNMSTFYNNTGKLITNASIIICPDHVGNQWCTEYYQKIKSTKIKRVILILTLFQWNNLTIADILFADLIIISYGMFRDIRIVNPNTIRKSFTFIESRVSGLGICLNHFHFKRIFLDEIHQIKEDSIYNIKINSIFCDYIWNITGTPFINGLKGYLGLLSYNSNINTEDVLIKKPEYIMSLMNNLDILFRRNTKENILQDLLSTFTYNFNLLEFTKEERDLYNGFLAGNENAYSERMMKLCCDPELYEKTRGLIASCKSLSEIREVIFKQLSSEIIIINNQIEIINTSINTIQDHSNDIHIRGLRNSLTVNLKNKENKEKTLNYMRENIIETVNHGMCCICLDDITNVSVTQCGHKYCQECIEKFINTTMRNNQFKCPQCNTFLQQNQVYCIKESAIPSDELSQIIQDVKSTKIGNIIYYIKHQLKLTDKIIIFSQWDELLHKVGNRISEYLPVLYCNGSLYTKNKAIKMFNESNDHKVIMLSSSNCASGINLQTANKIVFIEPINGNQKYRQETEDQACSRSNRIGNKHSNIEIIKFIIKDTIEEDIHNNNVDDSRMMRRI